MVGKTASLVTLVLPIPAVRLLAVVVVARSSRSIFSRRPGRQAAFSPSTRCRAGKSEGAGTNSIDRWRWEPTSLTKEEIVQRALVVEEVSRSQRRPEESLSGLDGTQHLR